ncbi:MAG: L-aspartate oxidase [Chloroflexi bacterium]|nr:L-aspartate oxidase [Chloroflexota bacterium]
MTSYPAVPFFDYVIVGSGIAGLYTGLLARESGRVLLLTKGSIAECNTQFAQGGIAAPIGQGDSPELHIRDTLAAGAGLSDPETVRLLAEEASDRIADLIRYGVTFDTIHGEIALAKEGAHSLPRVLHAGGDSTGAQIEMSLSAQARHDDILIHEHSLLAEIEVADGCVQSVTVFNAHKGRLERFACRFLVMATGGAGRLFKFTTNPPVALGDGVALAYQAGAEIMDMEFFQFHPTALRIPGVEAFLISEAVRGEGGILRNQQGERFMQRYSPHGELAPRDVVARAIVAEMKKTNADHVYLDIRHLPKRGIPARFPQIYKFCRSHGLDITEQLIPVAPAAHYMMGGIKTNGCGETNIKGLFAVGEVACTGVHGANRLASNSLLETVIFGKRAVERTQQLKGDCPAARSSRVEETRRLPERAVARDAAAPTLEYLQQLMWDDVGIERDAPGLTRAAERLAAWEAALPEAKDRPSYELKHAVLTSRIMAEAALARTESRGAHYRSDYPQPSDAWLKHIVYVR